MVGYPTPLMVWNPLCLDPSTGVFDWESDCTGSPLVVGLLGYSCWLVAGVDSIVFESIRWCVWSFRPSSPFAAAAP